MSRKAPASTKQDLLCAAQACFAVTGFEATKVEDITARAGIAKGAFYTYFASKDACWKELVDGFLAELRDVVDTHDAAVRARQPLSDRLEAWVQHDVHVFEFCWERRTMLRLLTSGAGGIAYAHLLDEFAQGCARNAESLVRQLMTEGIYRSDIDPKLVASMLGGAYDRLVREQIQRTRRPNLERMLREAQRMFLHGLLTDPSRKTLSKAR
jgi:AcrR family transcriptional regulator